MGYRVVIPTAYIGSRLKESTKYINKSEESVKAAIIMQMKNITLSDSISILTKYEGNLKKVLDHYK